MVHKLRCLTTRMRHPGSRVAGELAVVLLAILCLAVRGRAQEPAVHYWHQGVMPPGAIGSRQLQRGGPLAGFFQPVEIKAPPGVSISLAVANQFGPPQAGPAPRRAADRLGLSAPRDEHSAAAGRRDGNLPYDRDHRSDLCPRGPASPLRDSRGDRPARHRTGHARQVRHAGDLPGRSAQRPADAQQRAASRGSKSRRAAIRWRWPTSWAGRWRFSAWAPACPTRDRTPTSTSARRPGWPIRRARPDKPSPSARPPRPDRPHPRKRSRSHEASQ